MAMEAALEGRPSRLVTQPANLQTMTTRDPHRACIPLSHRVTQLGQIFYVYAKAHGPIRHCGLGADRA